MVQLAYVDGLVRGLLSFAKTQRVSRKGLKRAGCERLEPRHAGGKRAVIELLDHGRTDSVLGSLVERGERTSQRGVAAHLDGGRVVQFVPAAAIGRVVSIDADLGEVLVQYEGRTASYLADDARQLVLAYAVTIHKSQGSEYPAVVIPLHMQHYVMLQRNLLYTAITRGRRLVCIVGTKKALWRAIKNVRRRGRYSALGAFLKS